MKRTRKKGVRRTGFNPVLAVLPSRDVTNTPLDFAFGDGKHSNGGSCQDRRNPDEGDKPQKLNCGFVTRECPPRCVHVLHEINDYGGH